MGIESVDRIVRTSLSLAPDVFEAIGECGEIFTIQKHFYTTLETPEGLLSVISCSVKDPMTGMTLPYLIPSNKEFNILEPDTLENPVTYAEMVLALHDKGIDF